MIKFGYKIFFLSELEKIKLIKLHPIVKAMKSIGYLECQKGGYHTGEFLNIVCLEPICKENILCCCACIEEMHQNHKTKTLKKLIIDADGFIKNVKQFPKVQTKESSLQINTDIMTNMVENEEKSILSTFNELKVNILKEMDNLESGIQTYYKLLHQQINKQQQDESRNPKIQLAEAVELVQGSSDSEKLKINVLKLMKVLQKCQQLQFGKGLPSYKPSQESYFNFLKNSNNDIGNIVNIKIQNLSTKLQKEAEEMKKILEKVDSFWKNNLFTFSQDMHHDSVDLLDPFIIRANVDSIYQMALMDPPLTFKNGIETFTFRVNANDFQWVAFGVSYKKIAEKGNFNFRFNENHHGCYLISGNAGSWSHSQQDFNNCVKAFNFKEGDSVTCTVSQKKICFFRNVNPELEDSPSFAQKEYYELEIELEPDDTLHPCVVSYYMNTEVEYLPSFKNLHLQMPNYHYKFSWDSSHHCTIITNDINLQGCDPVAYKCCVLDTPIQKSLAGQSKPVTFRIVRSTGGWIGVGLCHKKIVSSKNYDFQFEQIGHGCYMISANGGSWSHLDPQKNNIVRTYKFVEGDLITISLDESSKIITFAKGIDKYKLPYKPIEGDELYPVVVLFYPEDQVEVLPDL